MGEKGGNVVVADKEQENALKCLDMLYSEYRSAEQYLHIITVTLLGILAYLGKDFTLEKGPSGDTAIYSVFILLFGINVGIGLIYTWYLGTGISICDLENKLPWLPVRPYVQANIGIMGDIEKCKCVLFMPMLLPVLAGTISSVFFLITFILPRYFTPGCPQFPKVQSVSDQWIGIGMTAAPILVNVLLSAQVTLRFKKAVLTILPARNLEIGAK